MLETVISQLLLPFTLLGALGFWWYAASAVLCAVAQGFVYVGRRGYYSRYGHKSMVVVWDRYVGAVFFLVLMLALVNWLLVADTKGFWATVWATLSGFSVALLYYLLYGMLFVVPLWMLHARRVYEELDQCVMEFIEKVRDNGDIPELIEAPTEDTRTAIHAAQQYVSGQDIPEALVPLWQEYRERNLQDEMRALDPMENRTLIAFFIALWPFFVLDAVLGDLLYRLARWIVTGVARIARFFTRIMRYGMARNIDQ